MTQYFVNEWKKRMFRSFISKKNGVSWKQQCLLFEKKHSEKSMRIEFFFCFLFCRRFQKNKHRKRNYSFCDSSLERKIREITKKINWGRIYVYINHIDVSLCLQRSTRVPRLRHKVALKQSHSRQNRLLKLNFLTV